MSSVIGRKGKQKVKDEQGTGGLDEAE